MTEKLILMINIEIDHSSNANTQLRQMDNINYLDGKCSVWPDNNLYFRIGIYSKIVEQYYNHLSCNLVFVDFSHYNLNLFSDVEWIDRFSKANVGLILVSDYKMDNYASYWWKNAESVATVIYSGDSRQIIRKKVRDVFIGRWQRKIKSCSLTQPEVDVLNLLIQGVSITEVASRMDIDIKKIYNIKQSLRRKFGVDINTLYLFCCANNLA
ncbi:hypothetical protein EJE24_19950 [Enterobacter huaxiensis]|uniref:Uncharacterized protein n=2 Tax=Enterobacter huaxiensis TaxID=2494702 RepID=A0A3R9N9S1_9ENTR|nr:hypothetical protein EJE24_19950 [Enterobacter huaxiensis]